MLPILMGIAFLEKMESLGKTHVSHDCFHQFQYMHVLYPVLDINVVARQRRAVPVGLPRRVQGSM